MAEVKWLPAVDKFAMFLQRQAAESNKLNTQIYDTKKRINTELFAANVQKSLAEAKNEKELLSMTGMAYSEALARGYSGAVPMIGQYSNLYGTKLGIEKKDALGRAYLDTLPADQQRFVGNQAMTVSQIKEKFSPMFPDDTEAMMAELISKLPEVQKTTNIAIDEEGKAIYTEGYMNPSGQFVSTATGKESISKVGNKPYLEAGITSGFQEAEDRYLSPDELQEYTMGMSRHREEQRRAYQLSLYDKDNLSLSSLKEFEKMDYFARTEHMQAAYMQEVNRVTQGLEPDSEDYKTKVKPIREKYYGSEKSTQLQATDFGSLIALNPEYYAANRDVIETQIERQNFNEEMLEAGYAAEDLNKYRKESIEYKKSLSPEEKDLFQYYDAKERYNLVKRKKKPLSTGNAPSGLNPEFQSKYIFE